MSKHTPGRWFYSDNYVFSDNEFIENNTTVVCRAATAGDARLIAVAPELLNLAELVVDLDTPEDMAALYDMATKLIAKIRGEE